MAIDPFTAVSAASAAYPVVKDIGGNLSLGIYNALPASWGKWRKPLATAPTGLIGMIGFDEKLKTQEQQQAADQLIDNFMKNPGSQFVNPQLLARAQRAAGGGLGRDQVMTRVARDWVAGEGGLPYDTNLANQLLRGDIPPSVAAAMDRQLGTRFDRLRRDQGGQLARSGVLRSSAGGRLMADTYDSQRQALSDAYMNTLLMRQQFGLNLLGAADASRRAYATMGAHELGRQADRDLAYQQMGFNVLSDADRRKFARETFGVNARLAQLGQQQVRRDATLEASGNILGNLYTNYRDEQRFNQQLSQQGDQFSQLINLTNQGNRVSPIQAKADLSAISLFAPDSVMKSGNRFKTLGESRTGAGGYGARNTPLTSRY